MKMYITLLGTIQVLTKSFIDFLRLFIHSLRVERIILELFPNLQARLQEIEKSLGVSVGLVTNLFTFHSLFHGGKLRFKHAFLHSIRSLTGCNLFSFLERHL